MYGIDFNNYSSFLGDRRPDFTYASKGLLKKIKYPTKGYTTFEYEPIIKDQYTNSNCYLSIYNNMGSTLPQRIAHYAFIGYDPFDQNSQDIPPLPYTSQAITINLQVIVNDRSQVNYRDCIYIKIKNIDTGAEQEQTWFFPAYGPDATQTEFNPTFQFGLANNQRHMITMGFRSNVGGAFFNNNASVQAGATFTYASGLDENNGTGIRIKRVKDFVANDSIPTNIKRIYYKKLVDVKQNREENLTRYFMPNFHNFSIEIIPACTTVLYLLLNSNSFAQNFLFSDTISLYPEVSISLGGDNFENGAIEKRFLINYDKRQDWFKVANPVSSIDEVYFNSKQYDDANKTNLSNFNGTLLSESFWRTKNGVLSKIKKTDNQYFIFKTNTIDNIVGNSYSFGRGPYFGLYKTHSHKVSKINEKTTEFIDGVPLTAYTTSPFEYPRGWPYLDHDNDGINNIDDLDFITPEQFEEMSDEDKESNYRKIINTKEINYYDNIAGLPASIKTINSNNETKEVKNFYPFPNNIAQVNGLNATEINALNALKSQNRVNTPFQVETHTDTEKLFTQRIIYKSDEIQNSAFEYKIQTAKGNNPLEDRIVYHNYDNRGNPVELSLKDGTRVVYIWSYQRKPILKIIGATYTEVVAAMSASGGVFDPSNTAPSPVLANPFITSLPNAQVTIYNYDPITQFVKSVIDPNGKIVTYEYDTFSRLKLIKDNDGKIIEEYDYNYRPN